MKPFDYKKMNAYHEYRVREESKIRIKSKK